VIGRDLLAGDAAGDDRDPHESATSVDGRAVVDERREVLGFADTSSSPHAVMSLRM
jgi:hypothetical protein